MKLKITNIYDGESFVSEVEIDLPLPEEPLTLDNLDEWAEEHLFPLTGLGYEHEEASYHVLVVACPQKPALIGYEADWGF